jgi:hypothetical protein
MIMFGRWIADAEYPIKQVGVGAIEQRLKSPELTAIQGPEGVLGERAENEVAFLRPAMPAPKQEAPAADIRMFAICGMRNDMSHKLFSMSLLKTAAATRFSAASADSPNASAITLLVFLVVRQVE